MSEELHRLTNREWLLVCAFRECPESYQHTTERFVYAALHHSATIRPTNVVQLFKSKFK